MERSTARNQGNIKTCVKILSIVIIDKMTSLESALHRKFTEGSKWAASGEVSDQAQRNVISPEASKFLDILDDLNMLPDPKVGSQKAYMKESLEALLKDNIEETQGMNLSSPALRERYNQHLAMAKEILDQYEKMSGGKRSRCKRSRGKRSRGKRSRGKRSRGKRSSKRNGRRSTKRVGRKYRKQKGGNFIEKIAAEVVGLKTRKRKHKNRRTRKH